MSRLIPVALIMLLAGFAAARWLPGAASSRSAAEPGPAGSSFDASQPVLQRLGELERAVNEERQARQLLQEELVYLTGELDDLRLADPSDVAAIPDAATEEPVAVSASNADGRRSSRRGGRPSRSEQLIAAGFSPDRAVWIEQRESQLQLELLEARYEAQRNGDYDDYRQLRDRSTDVLRDELGPVDYENYLEGIGRPTTVTVSSVMDGSPAQNAGLRPGDEIVSYAGNRTYSMNDLNQATLEGQAGQTVLVDIMRDGVPMQVALPRGAVGITGGGRRNR